MKNNQKGFIGIALAVIGLVALGAGGYVVYKNKTSSPVPVTTTEVGVPENKEEADSIPTQVAATSSIKASSATTTNLAQPIGDYEVKVITPIVNKKFYIGDTLEVVVEVGKNIDKILMVAVGIDPNFEKNTTITKLSESSYNIRYRILDAVPTFFIGQNTFQVQGLIDPDLPGRLTKEQVQQASVSIPIILDSRITPTRLEAETPLVIKVGSHTVPTGPFIAIDFADKSTAIAVDQSVVRHTIADTSIASIRDTLYDPFGTGSKLKVVDIVGNKVGTTTLTLTYKNLSKTVTVNVTN